MMMIWGLGSSTGLVSSEAAKLVDVDRNER